MTSLSLEAVELSKRFGSFSALTNLNLKIEGSKCVGFLGPNGAGKTTTLKIFTDLIFPTSGKALINGIDVPKDKKRALEATAALVETPEVYPALTPKEALMMVAEHRGVPKDTRNKKIEEALHEVRMEEWANKRVGNFSKGMKQRVALASTLVSDPEIILLDEPTNGLDPRGMREIRELVRNLKKKDRLIFMSSHLLPEVTEICDEVAIIDHGKLLVYDTLANVTTRFAQNAGKNNNDNNNRIIIEVGFSRPLDNPALIIKSIVESVPGVIAIEQQQQQADDDSPPAPLTMQIAIEGGTETQERLLSELVMMKLGMISFRQSQQSISALENVYLNLIKETL